MQVKSREIKVIPIDQVKEHEKNSNRHPIEQIVALTNQIEFQGFRVPLIISNLSGKLVSGHCRSSVAKKLGMQVVPVIYQDFATEAQEYAFLTADNAISEWSKLDFAAIYNDIDDLDLGDLDLLGIENFKLPDAVEDIVSEPTVETEEKEKKNKCPNCAHEY